MEIKKLIHVNELLDIYGNLLTPKQKNAMQLYYQENLSFGEIGEELGISRQAAYDTIKKSENLLYSYEDNLNIQKMQNDIQDFKNNVAEKLLMFKEKYNVNNEQLIDLRDIIKLCEESK